MGLAISYEIVRQAPAWKTAPQLLKRLWVAGYKPDRLLQRIKYKIRFRFMFAIFAGGAGAHQDRAHPGVFCRLHVGSRVPDQPRLLQIDVQVGHPLLDQTNRRLATLAPNLQFRTLPWKTRLWIVRA